MYLCVFACPDMHDVGTDVHGGQRDPLGQELLVVLSCLMWVFDPLQDLQVLLTTELTYSPSPDNFNIPKQM